MAAELKGKKIAFLATDGFEQAELFEPRKALDDVGAETVVIAPKSGEIKAWDARRRDQPRPLAHGCSRGQLREAVCRYGADDGRDLPRALDPGGSGRSADGQFIFSRKPDDIPAFNRAIIESVGRGSQRQAA